MWSKRRGEPRKGKNGYFSPPKMPTSCESILSLATANMQTHVFVTTNAHNLETVSALSAFCVIVAFLQEHGGDTGRV